MESERWASILVALRTSRALWLARRPTVGTGRPRRPRRRHRPAKTPNSKDGRGHRRDRTTWRCIHKSDPEAGADRTYDTPSRPPKPDRRRGMSSSLDWVRAVNRSQHRHHLFGIRRPRRATRRRWRRTAGPSHVRPDRGSVSIHATTVSWAFGRLARTKRRRRSWRISSCRTSSTGRRSSHRRRSVPLSDAAAARCAREYNSVSGAAGHRGTDVFARHSPDDDGQGLFRPDQKSSRGRRTNWKLYALKPAGPVRSGPALPCGS